MPTQAPDRPDLDAMFRHDLGGSSVIESEPRKKPLMATLNGALGLKIQAYLWHATAPYERELGAHKIQITLPGLRSTARIHIPREPDRLVLFCGYASQFDTWVLWDTELFILPEGISHSRNLQVSVEALADAVARGVSVSTKNARKTIIGPVKASIVTCRRSCLSKAIEERFRLNILRVLAGDD